MGSSVNTLRKIKIAEDGAITLEDYSGEPSPSNVTNMGQFPMLLLAWISQGKDNSTQTTEDVMSEIQVIRDGMRDICDKLNAPDYVRKALTQ